MNTPSLNGRVTRVVRAHDRVTMPWKNGGGVTHELLRVPTAGDGFAVRLSIAEVAADGPFSRFPGVDRVITLLGGAGMVLRRAHDGLTVRIDATDTPFAFLGEDAWDCTLVGGPVHDFNVMTDRASRRAAVAPHGPGVVRGTWALARAAGHIGGVAVAPWDLAELDGAVLADVPTLVVYAEARAGADLPS